MSQSNFKSEILNNDIVEAKNIHFSFGDRPVFRGLDLNIPRGKVTVIMGPSGCGKSTFLSLLGGRFARKFGVNWYLMARPFRH